MEGVLFCMWGCYRLFLFFIFFSVVMFSWLVVLCGWLVCCSVSVGVYFCIGWDVVGWLG